MAAAEEEVTISGSNFDPSVSGNLVKLNGRASEVVSASSTSIKFKVPPSRLGGAVSVATPDGSVSGPDLFVPPEGAAPSTITATGRVSLGSSKTMTISTASKRALLLVDGTKDQKISLLTSEASFAGSMTLYRPSGVSLGNPGFTKTNYAMLTPTLPETGTYTIEIRGTGAEVGSVKISAYAVTDISGSITPTEAGVKQSVSFTTPGQTARYTVAGTAGQKASVSRSNLSLNDSYSLQWLDPAGKQPAWNWWELNKSGFWGTPPSPPPAPTPSWPTWKAKVRGRST